MVESACVLIDTSIAKICQRKMMTQLVLPCSAYPALDSMFAADQIPKYNNTQVETNPDIHRATPLHPELCVPSTQLCPIS